LLISQKNNLKNLHNHFFYKKFRTIVENNALAMWRNNQNLLRNLFLKNGDQVEDADDFKTYLGELKALEDFKGALFSFIKIR